MSGHACIDFRPGTHWLVFATGQNGRLELVHDCEGAVAISPLIGSTLEDGGLIAQMEADFTAGLADVDQAARVVSIQRLGGLRSASSRPALHRVIERGSATEAKWAVYAALRTGDTSVLPVVRDLLITVDSDLPASFLAFELRRLKDPSAVPGLIEIANTAPPAAAREGALSALGENIRAIESSPTMASHLADPDHGVRYYALNGMRLLTSEPACTLPTEPRWTEDMVDPQIQECRAWWEQTGSLRLTR
jgi:HEAT repeat protein